MRIPREAGRVLRPALPELADEIIAAIAAEVTEYERAMEGEFGRVVRLGVEIALGRFLDEIEGRPARSETARETYVRLGRGELHAGRTLDALLAAYRTGARVAWRRFVEAGTAGGLSPEVLYRLGEAIFAYIDEISAESAEGYASEQLVEAGERRRRRERLARLIAADSPEEELRAAALEAGWPVPRRVAAVILGAPEDGIEAHELSERVARRIGSGALPTALEETACVLLGDPDGPGRRKLLRTALEGRPAVLGPAVEWARSAVTVQRALAAHRLRVADRLPARGLLAAEDHLPALLLAADPALAADLATTRLAPLHGLGAGPRRRLEATLRAWLDRPGQVQAIAAELGVHPQTVRYRVRQLRELFGTRLDDPEGRFELSLALRAMRYP
jgi:PucR C-terminal helix-turn-helix domain